MGWTKCASCRVIGAVLVALLSIYIVAVTHSAGVEDVLQITGQMRGFADVHPELIDVFEHELSELMELESETSALSGKALAKSECGEASLQHSDVIVWNRCCSYRQAKIKCNLKTAQCVLPPGAVARCGRCGAPKIDSDIANKEPNW
eukprot:GFYU01001234.1.p1 GENE.GFYU01001234.1~~GFYU01001234.1.p1  ORF type:complete len:147 (+),score=23.34 GFYU01001234.1:133-573(+)